MTSKGDENGIASVKRNDAYSVAMSDVENEVSEPLEAAVSVVDVADASTNGTRRTAQINAINGPLRESIEKQAVEEPEKESAKAENEPPPAESAPPLPSSSSHQRASARSSRRADSKAAIREEANALRSRGVQGPGAVAVSGTTASSLQPMSSATDLKASMRAEVAALRNQKSAQDLTPGAVSVSGVGASVTASSRTTTPRDEKAVIREEMNALRNKEQMSRPGAVAVAPSQPSTTAPQDEKATIRAEINALKAQGEGSMPGAVSVVPSQDQKESPQNSRAARASRKAKKYASSTANDSEASKASAQAEAIALALGSPQKGKKELSPPMSMKKPPPPMTTEKSSDRKLGAVTATTMDRNEKEKFLQSDVALGTPLDDNVAPAQREAYSAAAVASLDTLEKQVLKVSMETDSRSAAMIYDEMHKEKLQEYDNGEENGIVSAQVIDEEKLEAEIHAKVMQNAVAAEVVTEEELKANASGGCWKRTTCCLVLVAIILGVAIPLSGDDGDPMPPTESPTEQAPRDYLFDLVFPISGDTLLNETSPQYRAFEWLLNEDPAMLSIKEVNTTTLVERYAATSFYFSTNGESWASQLNFLSNMSICDWNDETYGVFCDSTNRYAVTLEMNNNNLNGTLPAEVSGFEKLEILSLAVGSLHGTLPPQLSEINTLSFLQLPLQSLTGTLPSSYTRLTNLKVLNLFMNSFEGSIPTGWFSSNSALTFLVLANNNFVGSMPLLNRQSPIQLVVLEENQFEGSIPQVYFQQDDLEDLYLSNNMLTGSIPEQVRALQKLITFQASGNKLTGPIPSAFGDLEDLADLALANNTLTGAIPSQLGRCTRLSSLDLSGNELVGSLPSQLGNLQALSFLDVSSNDITGTAPIALSELSSLETVDLSYTNIVDGVDAALCGDSFVAASVVADCGGDSPEVECECCTTCCSEESGCIVNIHGVCTSNAMRFESDEDRGTNCTCTEDGTTLSCMETCQTCNADGSICALSTDYGYSIDGITGEIVSFRNKLEYVLGRDETIVFTDVAGGGCTVEVNGDACQYCNLILCASGAVGYAIECSNIGGPNIDTCGEYDAQYLEVFYMADPGLRSGCAPIYFDLNA